MIQEGDRVVLWDGDSSYLVDVDGETKKISGLGVVNTERLVDHDWGESMEMGPTSFIPLQPTVDDIPSLIKRGPQIIIPRVCNQIVHYCDISCGDTVVEGGAGSGVLSSVLLKSVGTEGKVITYEINESHLNLAKKNIESLGLDEMWEPKRGDVNEDVDEEDVDAFVLDIPEPWDAVEGAREALKNGGFLAAYIPTAEQLKKTYNKMEEDFVRMKAFESLEREMKVGNGVRPSFDMLGHTGYIVVGRKTP